ncbi:cobalamin binding intrinsic factor-like [Haliotis cracherodii]|uniref:cobalamin binding intrinsic factor-like n=1 Tax=Haliotis cracherodii TaxID=6455 RepID=UPI0039EA3752
MHCRERSVTAYVTQHYINHSYPEPSNRRPKASCCLRRYLKHRLRTRTMSTLSCVCLLACVAMALTCQDSCCMCGPNITVTMVVENSLKPDTFKSIVQLEMPQRELLYFLQEAVAVEQHFRFTAEYFATPAVTGYFILSMNKVAGSTEDKTYWQILDKGEPTPLGVSMYVPTDGSEITFNFTTY